MTVSEDLDEAFAKAEHRMMIDHRLTPKEFVAKYLKGKMIYVTYWRSSKSERGSASNASRTKNLRAVEKALDKLDKQKGQTNESA